MIFEIFEDIRVYIIVVGKLASFSILGAKTAKNGFFGTCQKSRFFVPTRQNPSWKACSLLSTVLQYEIILYPLWEDKKRP